MSLKFIIRSGLLSLMLLNALFGGSGGIVLNLHHDFSFHLSADLDEGHVNAEHTEGMQHGHESSHHHHEISLSVDELPIFRVNEVAKAQISAPPVGLLLQYSIFNHPKVQMAGAVLSRAPPEVMQGHLDTLRTQVLRL